MRSMERHHALLLALGALGLLFAACNDVSSDGPSRSGGGSSASAGGEGPTAFSVFPVGGGAGGEGAGAQDLSKLSSAGWAMGGNPLRNCEESVTRPCYGVYACAGSQTCLNNAWTECLCDVNAGGATSSGGAASNAGAAGAAGSIY